MSRDTPINFLSPLFCGFVCMATIACTTGIHGTDTTNVQAGPPVQLKFSTEPSASAGAGVVFGALPVVQVEDANGNVVTSATNVVTLTAYTNSTCTSAAPGTFTVTNNSLTPTSGVASFTGVNYGGTSGTTIYIGASASGLTSTCSSAITINPGNPAKLVFSTEPTDPSPTAGVAFGTQPVVTVEDAYGNVVTSASNQVTLAAYTNSTCTTSGTGTFGATTNPVIPSSGNATFAGVSYTKSGTFYIGASSSGLTSACSNAISVAAGPPAQIVLTTTPWSQPDVNSCSALAYGVEDTYGNTATVTGSTLTLTLGSNGSAAYYSDSGCTSAITTANISVGQSNTGTIYENDTASENEQQFATATGFTNTGSAETMEWKLSAVLSFTPSSFAAGNCVSATFTTEDAKGNVIAVPANNGAELYQAGYGLAYSDSGCTTAYGSGFTIPISAGQSTATFYFKDLRAESLSSVAICGYLNNLQQCGPTTSITVTPATPADLIITGPTFEPPTTCAGPYTVTSTDQYNNVSSISGTALTVNLGATGSAAIYSNSGCTTSASSVSIGVGSSSQTFYVDDTVSETSTLTASATGFTSGNFNLDSTATSLLTGVASTGDFTCVLVNGGVKCWGEDLYGQLGNGVHSGQSLTPVSPTGLTSGVQSIIAMTGNQDDGDFACALKTDGTVWCWGAYGYGGADVPTEWKMSGTPIIASQISGQWQNACAVASGALYCTGWDFGNSGALTPELVLSSGVTSVRMVGLHTFCVTYSGGDLKCWGTNNNGEVGNGTTTNESSPVQVIGLTAGISAYSGSDSATCAVNAGALECWGDNANGVMAQGTVPCCGSTQKTPVAALSPLTSNVSFISPGGSQDNLCAILTSGALYCWGHNNSGQVGDNSTSDTGTPQEIFTSGATSVYAGSTTCAIVSGNLECWGANGNGAIGNDTFTNSLVPVYSQSLE